MPLSAFQLYVTALLAASLTESGQHTPIHVGPADSDGRHQLIAGAHRVAAARRIGLATLQATIFRGDALQAQLLHWLDSPIEGGDGNHEFFVHGRRA